MYDMSGAAGKAMVQPSPDVDRVLRDDRRPYEVAMTALTNAVLRLETDDGFLRERVVSLLGPDMPHEVAGEEPSGRSTSVLTGAVQELADRINASCARIEAVLDRLEI